MMDNAIPLKVAFTDFVFENREAIQLDGFDFRIYPPLRSGDEIVAAARGADILCMRDQFGQVTKEVFERLPELKLVVTRSVGYDHIDLEEAARRGIPVCHIPDYGAHMIAEQAFALLLSLARNVVKGDKRYQDEHLFSDKGLQGIELYGKTLGVVGTGRIGLHCIRIANGFSMHVIAHDVYENESAAQELGFTYLSFEKVSTQHLINAESLTLMKPGAILVNTARGAVVDTQALVEALRSGQLGGAGLDVLEDERDTYHDFSGLNVVVTPHLGWYTDGAVARILKITFEILTSFKRGEVINRLA
jgi:D-lactate dehydrogenase